jgi:sarcosine oxidase gamma subunit
LNATDRGLPSACPTASAGPRSARGIRASPATPRCLAALLRGRAAARLGLDPAACRLDGDAVIAALDRVHHPPGIGGVDASQEAHLAGLGPHRDLEAHAEGRVATPTFRTYHIPAIADVPRTEVIFADTHDAALDLAAALDRVHHPPGIGGVDASQEAHLAGLGPHLPHPGDRRRAPHRGDLRRHP